MLFWIDLFTACLAAWGCVAWGVGLARKRHPVIAMGFVLALGILLTILLIMLFDLRDMRISAYINKNIMLVTSSMPLLAQLATQGGLSFWSFNRKDRARGKLLNAIMSFRSLPDAFPAYSTRWLTGFSFLMSLILGSILVVIFGNGPSPCSFAAQILRHECEGTLTFNVWGASDTLVAPNSSYAALSSPIEQAIDVYGMIKGSHHEIIPLMPKSQVDTIGVAAAAPVLVAVSSFYDPSYRTEDSEWQISFWNMETGLAIRAPITSSIAITKVALSADGTLWAQAFWGGILEVRRIEDGSLVHTVRFHPRLSPNALVFSDDGLYLAITGDQEEDNDALVVWRTADWKEIFHSSENFSDLDFSPDSSMLVAAGSGPKLFAVHLPDGQPIFRHIFVVPNNEHRETQELAVSPDGRTIAVGTFYEIVFADVQTGRAKQTYEHYDRIRSLAFSTDGQHLYSGTDDGQIQLWRAP